jgi:hypothetical protein
LDIDPEELFSLAGQPTKPPTGKDLILKDLKALDESLQKIIRKFEQL